jgi:signal transduction histidine kinase
MVKRAKPSVGSPLIIGAFIDLTYREELSAVLWQRVDRLKALQQVYRGILAAARPREIAQAALDHIRHAIPCRSVSLTLFEPKDGRLQLLASLPPPDDERVCAGSGISTAGFGHALDTLAQGKIYLTDGVRDRPLPAATLQALAGGASGPLALVPLQCADLLLGSLNLAMLEGHEWDDRFASLARDVADALAVAIRHAQLDQAVDQHRERLRDLTARLAEADEAQRRRLARDLHDQIGQKLAALGINLHAIQACMEAERSPELSSRLEDSLELLQETTERVRHVIADLRPPMLDEYGLLATLRWCGKGLRDRGDVQVAVLGEEPKPRLDPPVEDALIRIAQEALTNVLKHARASQVTIFLTQERETVQLHISDDGVGFSSGLTEQPRGESWGMITMMERAEAVGGRCRITSRPGEGTEVIVEVEP